MTTIAAGWAASPFAVDSHLAYQGDDDEPAYAIADAWERPSDLALADDLCDRILAAARRASPIPSGNGTYYLPELVTADQEAVIDRFKAANRLWWNLDLRDWFIGVKHYDVGSGHPEHQDMHANGGARRKLAGIVQLSDGDDYAGGDLLIRFAHHTVVMPWSRGALIAMPGWTNHEVTTVTEGARWSLICNADGPMLR